ncbi:MAG: Spo0B domain-containing protein [Desulfotomaculaceae bacterium]|nr:Spo0B domain-containing protein [Desulfotomaculaceae bacterium]
MDLQKILEVVRVQRHDFLNHLQVVSGFLQLNKPDRIREYIEQIIDDMRVVSQTARLGIPEATAALLVGFNEAARYQIEMKLTVNSKLDECAVPGNVVGFALENVLRCFFENSSSPELSKKNFTLSFEENQEKHTIFLCSRASYIADLLLLKKSLAPVQKLLNKHGGNLNITLACDNLEIFLEFPRKRVENGQTTG